MFIVCCKYTNINYKLYLMVDVLFLSYNSWSQTYAFVADTIRYSYVDRNFR